MKTTRTKYGMAVCVAVLTATTAFRASADQSATAARPEKNYTGAVTAVDPQNHVLSVKAWLLSHKTFNLGDNCTYTLSDQNNNTLNGVRPGEKVTVSYQDAHGVLIADQVKQDPMRFEGTVKEIDPAKHTLTLHRTALDKELQLPDNCQIILRNDKPGTFADIQAGDHVTATYETPNGVPTARQIAQTSTAFTGRLTAIDLGEKTLKATTMFDSKQFSVADNCAIVINGKTDGQLSDLKPDEQLVLTYDKINGVNVVNRIAPSAAPAVPAVASEPMTSN